MRSSSSSARGCVQLLPLFSVRTAIRLPEEQEEEEEEADEEEEEERQEDEEDDSGAPSVLTMSLASVAKQCLVVCLAGRWPKPWFGQMQPGMLS